MSLVHRGDPFREVSRPRFAFSLLPFILLHVPVLAVRTLGLMFFFFFFLLLLPLNSCPYRTHRILTCRQVRSARGSALIAFDTGEPAGLAAAAGAIENSGWLRRCVPLPGRKFSFRASFPRVV